jgi:hypothetical protein
MMKVGGPAAANSSFTGFGARSIDELDKRTVKRCAVDDDAVWSAPAWSATTRIAKIAKPTGSKL